MPPLSGNAAEPGDGALAHGPRPRTGAPERRRPRCPCPPPADAAPSCPKAAPRLGTPQVQVGGLAWHRHARAAREMRATARRHNRVRPRCRSIAALRSRPGLSEVVTPHAHSHDIAAPIAQDLEPEPPRGVVADALIAGYPQPVHVPLIAHGHLRDPLPTVRPPSLVSAASVHALSGLRAFASPGSPGLHLCTQPHQGP